MPIGTLELYKRSHSSEYFENKLGCKRSTLNEGKENDNELRINK